MSGGAGVADLAAKRHERRGVHAVEMAPVAALSRGDSPRGEGESEQHVRLLSESDAALPPLLVHRPTMRVIDGMHRLRAARLRGQTEIEVVYFDGTDEDAFVEAVQANTAHGLPLSLEDRKRAARRILDSHPHWSDRRIASVAGLAPSTVRSIRACSTARDEQTNTRVGRDGTPRRLSATEGRLKARDLMRERPDASVREIAAIAGISPATVHNVRKRLREGKDAVPERQRATPPAGGGSFTAVQRDPALRLNEQGRTLIRALSVQVVLAQDPGRLVAAVPDHLRASVAALARRTAETWYEFATRLDRDRS